MFTSLKTYGGVIREIFLDKGLKEAVKAGGEVFTSSASSFFTSFAGSATIAIAAMVAVGVAINNYYKKFDKLVEAAENSQSAYSDTTTEIKNLQSEIDSTTAKIEELEAQGELTITEQGELERLRNQNLELERQKKLKEEIAGQQSQQATDDAMEALTLERTQDITQKNRVSGSSRHDFVDQTEYVQTDVVTATKNEIAALEELKEQRNALLNDSTDNTEQTDLFESLDSEIKKYESEISTNLESIASLRNNFIDQSTGSLKENLTVEQKDLFYSMTKIIDDFNNINLTGAEKDLANIESFFDGSVGKNFIKEYLLEAVESGRSASSALNELGFSLEDIGITGENNVKIFNDYFDGLVSSAEEAESALNSVAGTTDSVKAAFESENSGQTWADMTDYLKQAEELRKAGKIGTDEFQNMAQWISPSKIDPDAKNKDGSRKYATDAEAYAAAWDKAYKKVKRWFDADNPVDSMWNFVDDLEAAEAKFGKNLVDVDGNKITTQFKTTAEAAEALGVNVQVVDTLLRNLEDYGFEFDDVLFSGEGLMEYQSALEGIKQLYDSMDSGSNKDRLGNLIEGWDEDYAKCEEDLSNLTEDKIIHIQFEYDLATIQQQIDQLLSQQKGEGGKNAETNSEILAGNESYISKAKEGLGLDLEGVEIPAELKVADEEIDSLYKDLRNAEYGSDEFLEIQAEIQNKQELEKELLELFSEQHPEINAESNVEDVEKAWNDFFSGTQHLTIDATLKKDEVESQLNQLAKGSSITFTANVDGAERAVKAVKNKDGEIVYYSILDDGSQQIIDAKADKTGTLTFTSQDETKEGVNSAEKNIGSLPEKSSINLYANDKTLAGVSSAYKRAQAFAGTTFTAKLAVSSSGVHDLNGTAHLSGTVGDYSIPKLSGRALANGTLQNTDWLKRHWITDKGAYALTGEVGQELVVDAQSGEWFTVGDRGSEFSYIPSGSVVFNAQQTKDLLSKGHINSRGKSLLSGTAYGTGTLPSRGTSSSKTSSSGTSSSKTTTVKTSNKTTKSVNKALDAISQWFDWIEIRLDRLARNSENAEKAIDRAVGLANVLSATNDAITAIAKEQEAAEKGAARYLKAAQTVAKNTGLSVDLQKKVQNGTIDITKYSETTQKKIQEYQNW